MRKHRIERNLRFPSEEFRARVRTATRERGFRSEQAFILTACENELRRDDGVEATTQLEARIAATLANLAKQVQSLFTLAHSQFALTNSLLQYVLTCTVEPSRRCSPRLAPGLGSGTTGFFASLLRRWLRATRLRSKRSSAVGNNNEEGSLSVRVPAIGRGTVKLFSTVPVEASLYGHVYIS